jgi:hypothetical protein
VADPCPEPAIGAGEHVLAADQIGVARQPLGHQTEMLDKIGAADRPAVKPQGPGKAEMPIYKRIDAFAAAREVSARYVANDGPYLSLSGLGLLALILTVAAVQTIGATIMAGCFGNHGLSCRDTKSSNPSPSSGESDERPTRPLQSMIALMSVDDHPGFGRKTHAHMPEGLRTAGRAHGSIRIQEGQPTAGFWLC